MIEKYFGFEGRLGVAKEFSEDSYTAKQKEDWQPPSMNIDNVFQYHPPSVDQAGRYAELRRKGKELAELIDTTTPLSREQSTALTKVQEAVMWANAAIAINES